MKCLQIGTIESRARPRASNGTDRQLAAPGTRGPRLERPGDVGGRRRGREGPRPGTAPRRADGKARGVGEHGMSERSRERVPARHFSLLGGLVYTSYTDPPESA